MGEHLSCFKAYDIRGAVPADLDEDLARHIGRAFAERFEARRVVVGRDTRLSSPAISSALIEGLTDRGVDVVDIGMCGTENVYFGAFHLEPDGVDGGVMVTASHNPKHHNGMKLVTRGARPVSGDSGLFDVEAVAARRELGPKASKGRVESLDLTEPYVDHLLSYVQPSDLKPLKVVVNAGNGCAGPALDAVERSGKIPFEFFKLHHEPDGEFPNGVPNPILEENRKPTADAVVAQGADLGVAWDGDFDRCFFFDETGAFVEGYYVVGLFAAELLRDAKGAAVVHDPRLVWNTAELVEQAGGRAVMSKTGHAFIKERMRVEDAVYGGEMSAHHYFRDFAYCDSGMIPWLLMGQILSREGRSLSSLLADRVARFPVSGEINRRIDDPKAAIARVEQRFEPRASSRDDTDGLSLTFDEGAGWRLNLRVSNTEPILRLNVEARGDAALMREKRDELLDVIDGSGSAK